MIAYVDFVPRQLKAPALTFNLAEASGVYETFDQAVAAANKWLTESGVRVLHMETVVLPNIWSHWEQGTQDASIMAREGAMWHQFLRVWYQSE